MSGNELLKKYTSRVTANESGEDSDSDGTENLGAFGYQRGRDRCIMLELRKKTGLILAIGYGYIDRMTFDPSEGITLHAGQQVIVLCGRNLNIEARPAIRLFQGLTRNKVPWIAETDNSGTFTTEKNAVVIDAIGW